MLLLRAFAVLCVFVLFGGSSQAAELERPEGAVVVTVAGAIENTNRPAFDANKDFFLKYHERSFEKAVEFDTAMLAALGMHAVEINLDAWPEPVYVQGPYLRDLVGAVGGAGKTVTLVALDGYASEISWDDLQGLDWVVGLRQDGRPLGLGQRGPLWVVYTYPDGRALTADDELRWPWATFYIEIK
ncbi:hypothetical protein [Pelagibius marinus]|uniref:hypothetical protein n=1 Tax=Pelagibius marinus TaxID=2762760 RepID=UPI001873356B|nr:hypothetical protein [Pelagibius marinus]